MCTCEMIYKSHLKNHLSNNTVHKYFIIMKISRLTFKTIQSLVRPAYIAVGIWSCSMEIDNKGMNGNDQEPITEICIDNSNLADEGLLPFLGMEKDNKEQDVDKTKYVKSFIAPGNSFGPISTRRISVCNFGSLEQLNLAKSPITDFGIKILTRMFCPKLRIINLSSCQLSGIGFCHLIKAPWILEIVVMNANYFSIDGLKTLPKGIFKLGYLSCSYNFLDIPKNSIVEMVVLLPVDKLGMLLVGETYENGKLKNALIAKFPNLFC